MQGNSQIIAQLNRVLINEFVAFDQYLIHSKILKNWGLNRLATQVYQEAEGEKKHATMLIERLLFLEAKTDIQLLQPTIGVTLSELFTNDLALETRNQTDLTGAIVICEEQRDFGSREIFKEILIDTEEHIDWLETQLALIDRVGLEIYQQAQMFE